MRIRNISGKELFTRRRRWINAIAWCRDGFASTMRAATWARQTPAVTEDKPTVLTVCRVQDEPLCFVARDGLHNVGQVIFDLTLRDAQHLGKLV